jgi:hypothetical protein
MHLEDACTDFEELDDSGHDVGNHQFKIDDYPEIVLDQQQRLKRGVDHKERPIFYRYDFVRFTGHALGRDSIYRRDGEAGRIRDGGGDQSIDGLLCSCRDVDLSPLFIFDELGRLGETLRVVRYQECASLLIVN